MRKHHALSLHPVALIVPDGFGVVPFALSDVGWLLVAAAVVVAFVLAIGAAGRRRRRGTRTVSAVQRGTTGL